jgi:tetratricopeptide (TPR) repeat protein
MDVFGWISDHLVELAVAVLLIGGSWYGRRRGGPEIPTPVPLEEAVRGLMDARRYAEAEARARAGVRDAETAAERAYALCLVAWAQVASGRAEEAEATVRELPEGEQPWPILLGLIAHGLNRPAEAAARFEETLRSLEEPDPATVQLLTSALVKAGRVQDALDLAVEHRLEGRQREVLTAALFYAGHYALALAECERQLGSGDADRARAAYNAACCQSRLGRPDQGVAWLSRAVDEGWTDISLLDADPDLAAVRAHPGYAAVRARLGEASVWQPPAT